MIFCNDCKEKEQLPAPTRSSGLWPATCDVCGAVGVSFNVAGEIKAKMEINDAAATIESEGEKNDKGKGLSNPKVGNTKSKSSS